MSFSRGLMSGMQVGSQLGNMIQDRRYTRDISALEEEQNAIREAAQNAQPAPRTDENRLAAGGLAPGQMGPPTEEMTAAANYIGPTEPVAPMSDLEMLQARRGIAARYNRVDRLERYDDRIGTMQEQEARRAQEEARFAEQQRVANRDFTLREQQLDMQRDQLRLAQDAADNARNEQERLLAQQNLGQVALSLVNEAVVSGDYASAYAEIKALDNPTALNMFYEAFENQSRVSVGEVGRIGTEANQIITSLRNTNWSDAPPGARAEEYVNRLGQYLDKDPGDGINVSINERDDGSLEIIEGGSVIATYRNWDELDATLVSMTEDTFGFGVNQFNQRQQRAENSIRAAEQFMAMQKLSLEQSEAAIRVINKLRDDVSFGMKSLAEQEEIMASSFRAVGLPVPEHLGKKDPNEAGGGGGGGGGAGATEDAPTTVLGETAQGISAGIRQERDEARQYTQAVVDAERYARVIMQNEGRGALESLLMNPEGQLTDAEIEGIRTVLDRGLGIGIAPRI